MILSLLLQITQVHGADTMAAADTAKNMAGAVSSPVLAPKETTLTLLDLLIKGGYLMIPIGILSLLAIYVLVERYIFIKKSSRIDRNFMNSIRDFVHNGNMDAAMSLCKNSSGPLPRMIEKGLSRVGKPIKEIEDAIENTGKLEIFKLEKNLGILGIIAGIAPMFGFVGTISGVIKIFYNISLADNISIGLIAGGLYEKMVTSAAGLIIGIFAFISYHWLNIMVDKVINRLETNSVEFIDLLQSPSR